MTEQEKANQIAGSFYEGFKKGHEQGLIAGQQLSYMANYECEVFLGGLSDRRRIQSLTAQVEALTAERDALKAQLDGLIDVMIDVIAAQAKAKPEPASEVNKATEIKIPNYYFTLDTNNPSERKRVFDTLVAAGVPVDEESKIVGDVIDPEWPFLGWSGAFRELATYDEKNQTNHYPPDQFLAQFGL